LSEEKKTDVKSGGRSFVIAMTPEMTASAGAPEGSHLVFTFGEGSIFAEILPPAGDELRAEVRQTVEELGRAYEELKRRGD
jgi:hypothetical protein